MSIFINLSRPLIGTVYYPFDPNSLIESAMKYVRGIWQDLLAYFNHPYLEISSNIAERAINPFVILTKKYL